MEIMGVTTDFWRGKRVFLTGHTGFKGSWLALWLQSMGVELTGFALQPPTGPNLFEVADVARGMTSIFGDIRDLQTLQRAIHLAQPEIVIHMAAQPLVRLSYEEPVETYATNVMGTVHLLEAIRNATGIRAVIVVTTDKCYENKEWVWGYRETEPMGGYDPYSSSKGCAELISAAYRSSFFNQKEYEHHGVAIATVRAGNVIGGGDWAKDRLIPDITAAFQDGKNVYIRNPGAIRPWQYVLEPLRGYLMLVEKLYSEGPLYAEAWNFGPLDEDVKTVQWITDQLGEYWGASAKWVLNSQQQPHEANYLKLDCSKANNRLGWLQATDISDALLRIVEWHRAYINNDDMRLVTINQIYNYEKKFNIKK
jgi:CDP-glucose 4,6-dehydratase